MKVIRSDSYYRITNETPDKTGEETKKKKKSKAALHTFCTNEADGSGNVVLLDEVWAEFLLDPWDKVRQNMIRRLAASMLARLERMNRIEAQQ